MTILALFASLSALASPVAAEAQSVPPADASEIRALAAGCGVPERMLEMRHDEDGDHAFVTAPSVGGPLGFDQLVCLLRWAEERGGRIGFISEPPPGTAEASTTLSAEDWRRAALALLAPQPIVNPTEVSVAAARAMVRARPRDADAWHQLGESLEVAGDGAEATEAYRRATRLPPRVLGRAYLHRDLAEALERQGALAAALAAARVSVRSWPLSQDGLFCSSSEARLLARLLVETGDLAGAAAFWRPLYEAQRERTECRAVHQALTGAAGREGAP